MNYKNLNFGLSYVTDLCEDQTVTQVCFLLLLGSGGGQNGGVLAETLCEAM